MTSNERDEKWRRLLDLSDRLLMYVQHHIPPEEVGIDELRKLITELKETPESALTVETKRPAVD